ncbi:MAG: hypothetical protein IKA03_00085 [Alphaproteobacteria bacterium]|nr:hypothetical protein [Alphaproteobacteria bacterium]
MKFCPTVFLLTLWTSAAFAEDVNITAQNRVEWHQKSQKVIAIGDAIATKGKMDIKADKLIGHYKERAKNAKGKISRVEAIGNVKMHSPKADAFGNNLDYNLDKEIAILTGEPAKIKTETETITAKESITYYPTEQKAIAKGNVEATDTDNNKIFSDKMVAYFEKSKDNKENLILNKVDIFGNIKIVTPDATVTADKGAYLPRIGLIKLFTNVVINQQGNILRGDQAETNLKTGISKLISGSKTGRVKGVFKEKK